MTDIGNISFRFTTSGDNAKIYDFAMRAISGTILPEFAEDAGDNLWERIEGGGYENVILAEDKDRESQVVGYIEVNPEKGDPGESVYITGIYVLPEYRRFGIGKKLLRMMVKEKRKKGEKLYVMAYKPDGVKFWEDFGFTIANYSLVFETPKRK
ncbi:MAG: GNAT family N-acetyltransferase [Candidatus Kariarchaeaceae archaeon]|jgi:ribosomal protein S18 acetylase RimI-like enzyme